MGEREQRRLAEERRLRRAAVTKATRTTQHVPDRSDTGAGQPDRPPRREESPGMRLQQQARWVEVQVRKAMERGEFDDLPGAGKPIRGLGGTHDPDWWVKKLVEREQVTGVLPAALALRNEDAELDAVLDRQNSEHAVRRHVEDFNARVVEARRQLLGGPPVVTPTRDVEDQVAAWRARREQRREPARGQRADLTPPASAPAPRGRRPRWWPRRSLRRRGG